MKPAIIISRSDRKGCGLDYTAIKLFKHLKRQKYFHHLSNYQLYLFKTYHNSRNTSASGENLLLENTA
jgi:hypothetical protein